MNVFDDKSYRGGEGGVYRIYAHFLRTARFSSPPGQFFRQAPGGKEDTGKVEGFEKGVWKEENVLVVLRRSA